MFLFLMGLFAVGLTFGYLYDRLAKRKTLTSDVYAARNEHNFNSATDVEVLLKKSPDHFL
ncbi:hypothetical protein JNUCC42_09915 [Brevibacterium sp. JNUCC-42]|nr:hypothetical protein JNUCC42_09915 [Brevibacterium sp. JNUCC-42]